MADQPIPNAEPAGAIRRLFAMLYDAVLILAVLIVGTFLFLPLTGGEAVDGGIRFAFQAYLVLLAAGFYGFFWMRGGQTLGLRTWRLRLLRADGGELELADVGKRLVAGVVTLGPLALVSIPFHPRRLSLTDMLSGSVVVRQRMREVV